MTTHSRPTRVAQLIQEELAQILSRGIKDPRVGFVTITGVKLAPDLRQATVYYSVMGDEAVQKQTQKGLDAATGFLRRELSGGLRLKHTPELFFRYDSSVATGDRIHDQLLKEAKKAGEES